MSANCDSLNLKIRSALSSMANQKTYSQGKKEDDDKKSEISNQIDLIPNLDFSPESHSSKDGLIEAKHDVLQGRIKEIPSFHLILCCQSQHEGERFSPEYSELRGKEAESSSNVYEQKGDIERTMESTPKKSAVDQKISLRLHSEGKD